MSIVMGIIFAICASVVFALSYTSIKKSYSSIAPSIAFCIDAIFGLVIWIPFALLIGIHFTNFGIIFLLELINAVLAEAFFFYVLSKGEISITGTILASYPIYTAIFSHFINKEHLHWLSILFIIITIIGTIIVTLPKDDTEKDQKQLYFALWAVLGALAIGFADTLNKYAISLSSTQSTLFALALTQIPVAIVYAYITRKETQHIKTLLSNIHAYMYAIIGSFFNIVGVLFLFLAFEHAYASIASPIAASYPGILIVLAVIFLKEKITRTQIIGLLCILIGIIGISFMYA